MKKYILLTVLPVADLALIVTGCGLETPVVSVVIGSSDGSANQTFDLTDIPIADIEIWVNEADAISQEEIGRLLAGDKALEVDIVTDELGNLTEVWVKWQEIDDLSRASEGDRYYEVDEESGKIRFGDGVKGARPPAGRNNIKASYSLSGGTTGG